MTTEIIVARLIEFFLLVYALWFCWTFLYKDYRIDAFRQDLFRLRDELFDFAAEERIPFDHPAYGILRIQINGAIRFAHQLSLTRVLVNLFLIPQAERKLTIQRYTEKLEKAFNCIEAKEVREQVKTFQAKFYFLIAKQLMLLNPLLWILSSLLLIYLVMKLLLKNISHVFQLSVRTIRETAEAGAVQAVPSNTVKFLQTEAYIIGNEESLLAAV